MKRWIIAAMLVLASGVVAAQPEFRGGPGGLAGPRGPGDGLHHMLHQLERIADRIGISDAQFEQIDALMAQARPELRELAGEMRLVREQLHEAAQAVEFDEGLVAGLARSQGDLVQQRIIRSARLRADVFGVLTPEQRDQLQTLDRDRLRDRDCQPGA